MAEVGQVLAGRYRLVELLGQGGMATIFRGHDGQLGRDVAVKVLRSEYGRDPAFVARFRQEAQSAAALSHPNVVNVFDYGMEAGDPFIVMELIDGGDLAGVLRERGALEPIAAARLAEQIFEALDAAHARGIVHRDIKPTNVLLTAAGRVKVADFGIARAFSEAQLTMPGTTLGSVHYFSPEQARGEMVTAASDVYSAGLVLFEMLTGRRAWTGDSAGAVAVARLAGDPPQPSSLQGGIPQILDIGVRRALARAPADRPTASAMAALLGRYIADPNAAAGDLDSAQGVGAAGAASAAGAVAGVAGPATSAAAGSGGASGPGGPPPPYPGYAGASPPGDAGPAYGTVRRPPRRMAYTDEQPEESSGSSAWGWIAAILGVLVLFAGGVLLFLLLSGRPPVQPGASGTGALVQTPSFLGQLLTDAQRDAEAQGLVMSVGAYQVTEAAPDTIISQEPVAGAMVPSGSVVRVTVSTTRTTVVVPDVRLRPEPELFAILQDNDLLPGFRSETYDPTVPATLIIGTNPRFGIEVLRGTAVDYQVSLGPPPTPSPSPFQTVPPTIEPTASPAPSPTPTPTPSPTPSPTPPPPTPPPTPTPTLTPVTVGNYATCGTLGEARAQIAAAGLLVGAVFGEGYPPPPPDDGSTWLVAQQYPAAGSLVPPGTEVHLFVKSPADFCP